MSRSKLHFDDFEFYPQTECDHCGVVGSYEADLEFYCDHCLSEVIREELRYGTQESN